MSRLTFSDGVSFNTDGKPRIERRHDGLYVVGCGYLISVNDREEAYKELASLQEIYKKRENNR